MTYWNRIFGIRRDFLLAFSVYLVGIHGIFILVRSILQLLAIRHSTQPEVMNGVYVDVLAGLSLVYLWSLLRRHKRNAWLVTAIVYVFILGFNMSALLAHSTATGVWVSEVLEQIAVPLGVLAPLVYFRRAFTVQSDMRGFSQAVRVSIILLVVTFAYGVSGFILLENKDFHEEISVPAAAQRTIDQFDLTTNHPLLPHTKRAKVFMDSLSVISVGSLAFVFISFFQPLRARHIHVKQLRDEAEQLLVKYPAESEDFFKLWPQDKFYLFSHDRSAGLAYRVERGVALVVGDAFGNSAARLKVVERFEELCYTNDWLPAFIYSTASAQQWYENKGYNTQLIGQEAVVYIAEFQADAGQSKYFRNIRNRFLKQGYTAELLSPPHDAALIRRLHEISDGWLERPGRKERGFMMGYMSDAYLQQCALMVARDSSGVIQAFLNQVPTFDQREANYDMLRSSQDALGNVNDYLLLSFIDALAVAGKQRLNLGLSPLAGLDESDSSSLLHAAIKLIYRGGDRFYSFQGLRKFKAKYQPEWNDRFIVYKNGVPGFARTVRALTRAMNHVS